MPFVFGKIYPEIKEAGMASSRYKILIISNGFDDDVAKFIEKIVVLRVYLSSLPQSIVDIDIFVSFDETPDNAILLDLNIIEAGDHNNDPKLIHDLAKKLDIDAIITNNDTLRESFPKSELELTNLNDAYKSIEIFVRGHEIPWTFEDIVWNRTWSAFYLQSEDIAKKVFDYYSSAFSKLGADKESLEMVRTLVLRISNVCYTRDKLLFYVIQKRVSKRNNLKRQDFTFEASYFLCHYYILLWGGIDQLARIINRILGINETEFRYIGLHKKKFLRKIKSVDRDIAVLFTDKKFTDWIEQLGRNRHYVAHEGSITLSPLVEEPKEKISDKEIEAEALAAEDYKLVKQSFPKELSDWYLASLKETMKLSKYKVVTDDISTMKDGKATYVFKPLNNIEWDFNNFRLIILRTFERLEEFLKEKQK